MESIFDMLGKEYNESILGIQEDIFDECYIPKKTILEIHFNAVGSRFFVADYDVEYNKIITNKDICGEDKIEFINIISKETFASMNTQEFTFLSKYIPEYKIEVNSYGEIITRLNNDYYKTMATYPNKRIYKDDYIFDEDKSVKWNREEVKRQNELIKKQREEYNLKVSELQEKFRQDCIHVITLGTNINKAQAEVIFDYSYRENHSGGLYDVVNGLSDLEDFITEILKLQNK